MHRISLMLKDYPMVGLASSLLGALQAFIRTSTPFLQYLALVLGVLIGAITLVLKVRELFCKRP